MSTLGVFYFLNCKHVHNTYPINPTIYVTNNKKIVNQSINLDNLDCLHNINSDKTPNYIDTSYIVVINYTVENVCLVVFVFTCFILYL